MLGAELSFHLFNVVLLTLAVAPLVLWRYRRAVLAGMQDRPGPVLPIAPAARRADRAGEPAPVDPLVLGAASAPAPLHRRDAGDRRPRPRACGGRIWASAGSR